MPDQERSAGLDDLDARARREVGALQAEMDRRFDTMRREMALVEDKNHAEKDALRREAQMLTNVLEERLNGIDKATSLLSDTVNMVPTDVQQAVSNMRDVMDEKFSSVDKQFAERDTRSEREARDNKLAVDAAFAAQEKQAVAQNDSNTLAITKSEIATTETINKLAELFKTTTDGLASKSDDVKEAAANGISEVKQRLTAIEARAIGVLGERTESFQNSISGSGWGGVMAAVVAVLVTILIAALVSHGFAK